MIRRDKDIVDNLKKIRRTLFSPDFLYRDILSMNKYFLGNKWRRIVTKVITLHFIQKINNTDGRNSETERTFKTSNGNGSLFRTLSAGQVPISNAKSE